MGLLTRIRILCSSAGARFVSKVRLATTRSVEWLDHHHGAVGALTSIVLMVTTIAYVLLTYLLIVRDRAPDVDLATPVPFQYGPQMTTRVFYANQGGRADSLRFEGFLVCCDTLASLLAAPGRADIEHHTAPERDLPKGATGYTTLPVASDHRAKVEAAARESTQELPKVYLLARVSYSGDSGSLFPRHSTRFTYKASAWNGEAHEWMDMDAQDTETLGSLLRQEGVLP